MRVNIRSLQNNNEGVEWELRMKLFHVELIGQITLLYQFRTSLVLWVLMRSIDCIHIMPYAPYALSIDLDCDA